MSLTRAFVFTFIGTILQVYLASSKQGYGPGEQDWGFAEIQKGAHLFYWLYYADTSVVNYTERPLIVWLQGGPGVTGSYASNFNFIGPLDTNLKIRNNTWTEYANLLFVDSPVDTGFSYVDNIFAYPTTNKEIALSLVEFMKIFYKRHPEFVGVPVHIFGESYGGKMAVEFALELYKAQTSGKIKSIVKSVDIINAWISPKDSLPEVGTAAVYLGVAEKKEAKLINDKLKKVIRLIEKEMYLWGVLYLGSVGVSACRMIQGISLFSVDYEVKQENQDKCGLEFLFFDNADRVMNGPVSKALNITKHKWTGFFQSLGINLGIDILKSTDHIVNQLVNSTSVHVNFISGSYDLLVPTVATLKLIEKLDWKFKSEYEKAPRKAFFVNGMLEGFEKIGKNLSMYWIHRSGHQVAKDNLIALTYILRTISEVKD